MVAIPSGTGCTIVLSSLTNRLNKQNQIQYMQNNNFIHLAKWSSSPLKIEYMPNIKKARKRHESNFFLREPLTPALFCMLN